MHDSIILTWYVLQPKHVVGRLGLILIRDNVFKESDVTIETGDQHFLAGRLRVASRRGVVTHSIDVTLGAGRQHTKVSLREA